MSCIQVNFDPPVSTRAWDEFTLDCCCSGKVKAKASGGEDPAAAAFAALFAAFAAFGLGSVALARLPMAEATGKFWQQGLPQLLGQLKTFGRKYKHQYTSTPKEKQSATHDIVTN